MSCGNKRSCVLKQTCSFKLQVCLSTYDLLLPPGIKGSTFKSICLMAFSKIFVWKIFCKLLLKFHAFSMFFRTPLDGWVFNNENYSLQAFYIRHWDNNQVAAWNYKSLIPRTFDKNALKIKFASPIYVKKNKWTFFQVFFVRTRTLVLRASFLCAGRGRQNQICSGLRKGTFRISTTIM